jgi:hypothetical protein
MLRPAPVTIATLPPSSLVVMCLLPLCSRLLNFLR